jgi:hypothetical protein
LFAVLTVVPTIIIVHSLVAELSVLIARPKDENKQ